MIRNASGGADTVDTISRRGWLASAVALGLSGVAWGDESPPSEAAQEASIRRRAKAAGVVPSAVGSSRSPHYLAVGNAPDAFRAEALDLCEALRSAFLAKFATKGFELAEKPGRMTVVVLADRASYLAFRGEAAGTGDAGVYDIETDRLIVYDAREGERAEAGAADPTRVNTFTLVHEAVHQLTFGTGLLEPEADVPVAISEGLATYGETWTFREPRAPFGQVNHYRLDVLRNPGSTWIDVEELLVRDELFEDEARQQAAYAEAWLLIHEQMKTRASAAKLRAYLGRLRARRDNKARAADATATLGGLVKLDRELKKSARLLLQR